MAEETIFSKSSVRKFPRNYCIRMIWSKSAFRDIHPQAPTHILIVPNKVIPTVNDVTTEDEVALGRLFTVARKLAAEEGIDESGYRLVVNCNRDGGQEVFHLHMHLLGGKRIGRLVQADA